MKSMQLAVILTVSSVAIPALADRPAMSERSAPQAAPAEPVYQTPAPVDSAPEPVVITAPQQTGDVLEIQQGETIAVRQLEFPRRGMSMSRVQNELGEPLQISPTVGQPPITTWSYPDRKVYFEGNTVIHAVATN